MRNPFGKTRVRVRKPCRREIGMENETTGSVPAADWYPDPRGGHELRYWDGTAWTDHVADGGQTSVDGGGVTETSSEPVLLTLHRAKEVRVGVGDPLVNVHLTDRRLLLEYLTSMHTGATIAGGIVGRAIAASVENKRVDMTDGPARTVNEIFSSPHEVRTVDYADVKKMLVRKSYGKDSVITVNLTRATVNASKAAVISFDREMFEQASELLAGMMPGRVTVKS
jgi:hypothetical protein